MISAFLGEQFPGSKVLNHHLVAMICPNMLQVLYISSFELILCVVIVITHLENNSINDK